MANSTIKLNAPSHFTHIELPKTIDLDDYSDTGFYSWTWGDTGTATHCPTAKVFTMIVIKKSETLGSNQMMLDNNGNIYYRVHYISGWQPWRQVTTTPVS